jgi:hypothetical protein
MLPYPFRYEVSAAAIRRRAEKIEAQAGGLLLVRLDGLP